MPHGQDKQAGQTAHSTAYLFNQIKGYLCQTTSHCGSTILFRDSADVVCQELNVSAGELSIDMKQQYCEVKITGLQRSNT